MNENMANGTNTNTKNVIVANKITQTNFQEAPPMPAAATSSNDPSLTTNAADLDKLLDAMGQSELTALANSLFLKLAVMSSIDSNPADFCSQSLNAMIALKENNKSNLIYKFAQAINLRHPTTNQALFPMDRMPFGLIQYQIEFFTCTHISQVC